MCGVNSSEAASIIPENDYLSRMVQRISHSPSSQLLHHPRGQDYLQNHFPRRKEHFHQHPAWLRQEKGLDRSQVEGEIERDIPERNQWIKSNKNQFDLTIASLNNEIKNLCFFRATVTILFSKATVIKRWTGYLNRRKMNFNLWPGNLFVNGFWCAGFNQNLAVIFAYLKPPFSNRSSIDTVVAIGTKKASYSEHWPEHVKGYYLMDSDIYTDYRYGIFQARQGLHHSY